MTALIALTQADTVPVCGPADRTQVAANLAPWLGPSARRRGRVASWTP